MKFLLFPLREGLGRLIVFISWLTRGKKLVRNEQAQAEVDREAASLSLYQIYACPFCVKVRRAMHRLNLPIETRNVQKSGVYRDELAQQGGRVKAPCLRIEDQGQSKWLYESSDIIAYLEQRFGR